MVVATVEEWLADVYALTLAENCIMKSSVDNGVQGLMYYKLWKVAY